MIEAFRIGGESANTIRVEILNRPWADKADHYDGNMVECQFHVSLGPISAIFKEMVWLFDLKSFKEEVEGMYRTLKGRAEFRPLSHALFLDLEMSRLGHVSVSGEACPCLYPIQKIIFDMGNEIDQTHLALIQKQLEKALEAFPIIGD